jgi:hypothetical protein
LPTFMINIFQHSQGLNFQRLRLMGITAFRKQMMLSSAQIYDIESTNLFIMLLLERYIAREFIFIRAPYNDSRVSEIQ